MSGRGLCTQRSPIKCDVSQCDRKALIIRCPWPTKDFSEIEKIVSRPPTAAVLNIKCLARELLFQGKTAKRCPYINKNFNDFLQNHTK